MTLYQKLEEISQKFPHKKALFFQKDKLTYNQLKERIENLAASFYYSLGIKKESKVAILLNNDSQYVISLFAVFRLGAVAIPINIFLKTQELDYILSNCNPDLLITSTEFLLALRPLREKIESKIVLVDRRQPNFLYLKDLIEKRYAAAPQPAFSNETIAVICYTSSTTGKPKGAMLTHENFISDIDGCLKAIDINYKDRFLVFLPMFHSYTLTVCIFMPLLIGATIYILSSFKELSKAARLIFLWRITIIVGIPRIFRMISKVNIPKFLLFFSPIRLAISGADALAPEIIRVFKKKFNITLLQGYGLTEAAPVVSLNPLHKQKLGSIGLPLPNCEIKVVDDNERELPPNIPGELIVRGPMVMKGYYQMPLETAQTIKGDWLFTGDIAKIDEEGYAYIVDRKKDLIITHGMNIYPREVEEAIKSHPKVEEVAVIGKKDPKRGEIPVALVVLKEGETTEPNEIISFLKEKIADYKIPHLIEFRKELPTTPTGKILKRILREEINK
jgi:long-chain acyl-CoA synthetase